MGIRRQPDQSLMLAPSQSLNYRTHMQLDDQLRRYFGTDDLTAVTPDAFAAGIEKMLVDFGLEKDRARRFGLWSLLHMLGSAPDLDVAFKDADDREAARNFMDMVARASDGSGAGNAG